MVVDKYRQNANALLVETRIKPPCNNIDPALETENVASTSAQAAATTAGGSISSSSITTIGTLSTYSKSPTSTTPSLLSSSGGGGSLTQQQYRSQMCPVCATVQLGDKFYSLSCAHSFCKDCWSMFFETQIFQVIYYRFKKTLYKFVYLCFMVFFFRVFPLKSVVWLKCAMFVCPRIWF